MDEQSRNNCKQQHYICGMRWRKFTLNFITISPAAHDSVRLFPFPLCRLQHIHSSTTYTMFICSNQDRQVISKQTNKSKPATFPSLPQTTHLFMFAIKCQHWQVFLFFSMARDIFFFCSLKSVFPFIFVYALHTVRTKCSFQDKLHLFLYKVLNHSNLKP